MVTGVHGQVGEPVIRLVEWVQKQDLGNVTTQHQHGVELPVLVLPPELQTVKLRNVQCMATGVHGQDLDLVTAQHKLVMESKLTSVYATTQPQLMEAKIVQQI
eukprot:TRINITY_DN22398_c0_g1_i1.p2 TRINITY_DN22398_c0_g1~~TRINITY_DN22398_c0_g1_i1.p2  ORF type:complete len:103 (-),score=10.05 TRINITY_DN22398_c0_g1_i1:101-409(-)